MNPAPSCEMSEAAYLAFERRSEEKHEFLRGQVYAMAGGTPLHAAIAMNVGSALRAALRGTSCGVASSDLRVHVPKTSLYTYPDLTVICGRVEVHPEDDTVVLNPRLLVEILSPTPEAYDRGAKFAHYERIPSLAEYLLVTADGRRLEHFRRIAAETPSQWVRSVVDANDEPDGALALPCLGIELRVADVLDGLELFQA